MRYYVSQGLRTDLEKLDADRRAAVLADTLRQWLACGVTAIDHAVEVFCSSPLHVVGDALKLAALRQLLTQLPRTQQVPEDLEARLHCQVGARLADHSPLRAQSLLPAATALPSHALVYPATSVALV